jgi:hypothetical protein
MGFVEVQPIKKAPNKSTTGVRLSCGPFGISLTFTGAALAALGNPKVETCCKIFHDADPALPRIRVEPHKDGRFVFRKQGKFGVDYRMVRVGAAVAVGDIELKRLDCVWEFSGKDNRSIDIDLPREFQKTQTATVRPASSTSMRGKEKQVTLPSVGARPGPKVPA